MSKKIILYDIASALSPQAWSPNCWKARYVLNFKRIPYETVYVSYPDIANLWQTLGLSPLDEDPSTTLPVISVPSEDGGPPSVIVDSFNIALFLDHEYPDTPRVIPPNTGALQAAFPRAAAPLVPLTVAPLIAPTLVSRLDPKGAAYFRETRERRANRKLEALAPDRPETRDERVKILKLLQQNLNTVQNILKANSITSFDFDPLSSIDALLPGSPRESSEFPGASKSNEQIMSGGRRDSTSSINTSGSYRRWVMGPVGPTFADFVLGSYFRWIKTMGDEELWTVVSSWNGGRWVRHLDNLEPWSQVL